MQSGASQLRDWMERRDVNLEEAADLLGFAQSFLSKLLNGHRRPGLRNAIRIENVAGVSVRAWAVELSSQVDNPDAARPVTVRKARQTQ